MPVYDYSYKTWEGERRGPLFRWLSIPKYAYMELLKLRLFTSILTFLAVMFLGRMALIYLFVNEDLLKAFPWLSPIISSYPVNGKWFKDSIDQQFYFCFVMAFIMGAGLISRDLKNNAVVLYASKPISRWEYFLGKFGVLFFLFIGLLAGIPLVLFVLQTAVAPAQSQWHLYFWSRYAKIAPQCAVYGFVVSTTLSLLMMACSSLTENKRYSGIVFIAFMIGSGVVALILAEYLETGAPLALSPYFAGGAVGDSIFGLTPSPIGDNFVLGSGWAWIGIVFYWIVSVLIIDFRVSRRARYGR